MCKDNNIRSNSSVTRGEKGTVRVISSSVLRPSIAAYTVANKRFWEFDHPVNCSNLSQAILLGVGTCDSLSFQEERKLLGGTGERGTGRGCNFQSNGPRFSSTSMSVCLLIRYCRLFVSST